MVIFMSWRRRLMAVSKIYSIFDEYEERFVNKPVQCSGSYLQSKRRIDSKNNKPRHHIDRTVLGPSCTPRIWSRWNCRPVMKTRNEYTENTQALKVITYIPRQIQHWIQLMNLWSINPRKAFVLWSMDLIHQKKIEWKKIITPSSNLNGPPPISDKIRRGSWNGLHRRLSCWLRFTEKYNQRLHEYSGKISTR